MDQTNFFYSIFNKEIHVLAGSVHSFVSSYVCLFVPLFVCLMNTCPPLESGTCSPDEQSVWGSSRQSACQQLLCQTKQLYIVQRCHRQQLCSLAYTDSVCICCLASLSRQCIVMPPQLHIKIVMIVIKHDLNPGVYGTSKVHEGGRPASTPMSHCQSCWSSSTSHLHNKRTDVSPIQQPQCHLSATIMMLTMISHGDSAACHCKGAAAAVCTCSDDRQQVYAGQCML